MGNSERERKVINSPWRNLFEQLQDLLSRFGEVSHGRRIIPVQQNPKPSAETQRFVRMDAEDKREIKKYANVFRADRRPEWREPKPSGDGPIFDTPRMLRRRNQFGRR